MDARQSSNVARFRALSLQLLCLGVVALPLQWWPLIPIAGAQLSDLLFLISAIVLLFSRPASRLYWSEAIWLLPFTLGVVLSAAINGGSYVKTLGHIELVGLFVLCQGFSSTNNEARQVQRALIYAALVGSLVGLVAVALYYLGTPTYLLNHEGDLLPGDYPRIRGTCFKANMLATLLATGLILLRGEPPGTGLHRYRDILTSFIGLALVFTFSRTWLTLAGGLLLIDAIKHPRRYKIVLVATYTAIVLSFLYVGSRYTLAVDPTHFWEVSIRREPGTRWLLWTDALQTIRVNPLFGVGPGRTPSSGWSAHLTWLNLWGVLGIIPTGAFALGVFRSLRNSKVNLHVATVIGVILFDGFARDVEDMRHLWILLGLLVGSSLELEHSNERG